MLGHPSNAAKNAGTPTERMRGHTLNDARIENIECWDTHGSTLESKNIECWDTHGSTLESKNIGGCPTSALLTVCPLPRALGFTTEATERTEKDRMRMRGHPLNDARIECGGER